MFNEAYVDGNPSEQAAREQSKEFSNRSHYLPTSIRSPSTGLRAGADTWEMPGR
jgi:hypothetical protein